VKQELRGRGLGGALMDEIERRLKAKGCLRSYLLVRRNNSDVLDFYTRRGWAPLDIHIVGKDL